MLAVVVVVGLAVRARPARADEALEAHESADPPRAGRWLELDPTLRPRLEGLGAVEERHRSELRLGPRTRAVLEGSWWANEDDGPLPVLDLPARGWRAALRLSHDFGFARLDANAGVSHVDMRFGSGSYVELGISLGRTFRLSRWMTGWISLGIGRRQWLGDQPPAAESDATEVMLRIGTTFR